MRTKIAVWHQYAYIVVDIRLIFRYGNIYYVLVHAIRRWSDLDPNAKLFGAKLEEGNGGLGD